MNVIRAGLWILAIACLSAGAFAADVSGLVKTVKAVGPEGQGNAAASKAVAELSKGSPDTIVELVLALDDASPRATNYLRGAIQNIAQKAAGKLPTVQLEAVLNEPSHNPAARKLVYDLLVQVDPAAAERLIPGFEDDPSTELRRLAVQRLIDSANALVDDKKVEQAKPVYQKAMTAARDGDQVKVLVDKLGGYGETVNLTQHFGFLTTWWFIGPFDNTDKKGFNVAYPPEDVSSWTGPSSARRMDLKAELVGKEDRKLTWTKYTAPEDVKDPENCGVVDVKKALDNHKGAVAYAYTEFDSPREQAVDLRMGTSNAWKVWLNGELVFGREEYHRGEKLDQYRMRGTLKSGRNTLLIKVCQNEQTEEWAQKWQFRLRICDGAGTAVLAAPQTAARTGKTKE